MEVKQNNNIQYWLKWLKSLEAELIGIKFSKCPSQCDAESSALCGRNFDFLLLSLNLF